MFTLGCCTNFADVSFHWFYEFFSGSTSRLAFSQHSLAVAINPKLDATLTTFLGARRTQAWRGEWWFFGNPQSRSFRLVMLPEVILNLKVGIFSWCHLASPFSSRCYGMEYAWAENSQVVWSTSVFVRTALEKINQWAKARHFKPMQNFCSRRFLPLLNVLENKSFSIPHCPIAVCPTGWKRLNELARLTAHNLIVASWMHEEELLFVRKYLEVTEVILTILKIRHTPKPIHTLQLTRNLEG